MENCVAENSDATATLENSQSEIDTTKKTVDRFSLFYIFGFKE
jgi:hypothetical protein